MPAAKKSKTAPAQQTIDVGAGIVVSDSPKAQDLVQVATINVENEIAKFDPVRKLVTELQTKISSTAYDITTTVGEDTARELRRMCVSARTSADRTYEIMNEPMLKMQRKLRELVAGIKADVAPYEDKLDAEIKVKEAAREAEKQRKIAEESARIGALRAKITAIAGLPAAAVVMKVFVLGKTLAELKALVIDETSFGEFVAEAEALRGQVAEQLQTMLTALIERAHEDELIRARQASLAAEEEHQKIVAALRERISKINNYPLQAMGNTADQIRQLILALPVPGDDFGDMLTQATEAYDAAVLVMSGAVIAAEAAEKVAHEKKQEEDRAAADRVAADARRAEELRVANEIVLRTGQQLKNQQDAFAAEQVEAQRRSDATALEQRQERERLDAEAARLTEAAKPPAPPQEEIPPPRSATEAAIEAEYQVAAGEATLNGRVLSKNELNDKLSGDIVEAIMLADQDLPVTEMEILVMLLDPAIHQALARRLLKIRLQGEIPL